MNRRRLLNHRRIQPFALASKVCQRCRRIQIQQRRTDAHLNGTVDQQHALFASSSNRDASVGCQSRFAHAAFIADERHDTAKLVWARRTAAPMIVGGTCEQPVEINGRQWPSEKITDTTSHRIDQHGGLVHGFVETLGRQDRGNLCRRGGGMDLSDQRV